MLCRLSATSGALLCSLAGCFNPEGNPPQEDTDTDGDTMNPSTTVPSTTDEPSTSSISETNPPTSNTMPEESSGEPGVVCGDGNVEGDEVCDDGTNDGSYGSCTADCSAFGPRCGDTEVNGPEACDDGTNDNSYGGCAEDCSALGPYCGDGMLQNAEEMCDNGEANANGGGCNVDCVTSGTLLFEYETPLGSECWGYSEPVADADGNIRFAYYDACDQTWTFRTLSPELEEVESTDALLSGYPFRATMRGTDWLLGSYNCTVIVTDDGTVTEVCGDPRIGGGDALKNVDDSIYIALQSDTLAQWGAASPAGGDAPDWTASAPTDSTNYNYGFYTATPGALGSVTAGGRYRYYDGVSTYYYYGYVSRFNSAGNPVNSNQFSELTEVYELEDTSSGALIAIGSDETGNDTVRLNANLNVVWAIQACTYGSSDLLVDSADQIVLDCSDEYPARYLRKLDDEGNELWRTDIESDYEPISGRLAHDADDNIIRLTWLYDSLVPEYRLRIEKYAP